jgi:large subunit ribosomal protein L9
MKKSPKTLKVVFIKESDWGQKGEGKNVARGFAINFLIPKGIAVLPDNPQARKVRADFHKALEKKSTQKGKFDQVKEALAGKEIKIATKVTTKDTLYKAVSTKDIIGEIFKLLPKELADFKINQEHVKCEPIKKVGQYKVAFDFGHDQIFNVIIKVEKSPQKGKS